MFYDANGNLIRDMDRGITAIRYNILNLPDTIIFSNGNRIINLYDATGRKYKSIVYTIPATAVTSSYDLEHEAYGMDSVEYRITEYNGNIETCYTPRDTTRRIFNLIGYYADSTYYYTRQSLNGTEIIDEETGSFETQSNEQTDLNGYENVTPSPHKFLENGQMLIRSGNATYNVQGKRSSK